MLQIHCLLACIALIVFTALNAPVTEAKTILKVTTILTQYASEQNPITSEWTGFYPELMRKLGQVSEPQFEPEFSNVKDGNYGAKFSNGTWNGMIGEVASGKVDAAAAALMLTEARYEAVDFTLPVQQSSIVSIGRVHQQQRDSDQRDVVYFLRVCSSGVWLSLLLMFCATLLVLAVNARFNPRESAAGSGGFSNADCLLFALCAVCFQGYKSQPKSTSSRCIGITWCMMALLFTIAFVSAFIHRMVASSSAPAAAAGTDLRDLFTNNREQFRSLIPMWISSGSTDALMRSSSDPMLVELNQRRNDYLRSNVSMRSTTHEKLIELTKSQGKFVLITDSTTAAWIIGSSCSIVQNVILPGRTFNGIALANNSNWTRVLNRAVIKLKSNGGLAQLKRKYFERNSHCAKSASTVVSGTAAAGAFRKIDFSTIAGPVILFCIGLLLSVLAAILEIFVLKRERSSSGNEAELKGLAGSDRDGRQQQELKA